MYGGTPSSPLKPDLNPRRAVVYVSLSFTLVHRLTAANTPPLHVMCHMTGRVRSFFRNPAQVIDRVIFR
jgi:hypothetical protein